MSNPTKFATSYVNVLLAIAGAAALVAGTALAEPQGKEGTVQASEVVRPAGSEGAANCPPC